MQVPVHVNTAAQPVSQVAATFKGAKMVAYIGAIVLAVLLIGAWPASSSAIGVFTYDNFKIWVSALELFVCLLNSPFGLCVQMFDTLTLPARHCRWA